MRWKIRKLWAMRPFVWFQRCCICGRFGVKQGIHSYMTADIEGKICMNCLLDMVTEVESYEED